MFISPKEVYDSALPSGNSAAAVLFEELYRLTGKALWQQAYDRQRDFLSASCAQIPAGCAFSLLPVMREVYGGRELVCALNSKDLPETLKTVLGRYAPELTVLIKSPEDAAILKELAPFTADMHPQQGRPAYYVCQNGSCSLPVTEL